MKVLIKHFYIGGQSLSFLDSQCLLTNSNKKSKDQIMICALSPLMGEICQLFPWMWVCEWMTCMPCNELETSPRCTSTFGPGSPGLISSIPTTKMRIKQQVRKMDQHQRSFDLIFLRYTVQKHILIKIIQCLVAISFPWGRWYCSMLGQRRDEFPTCFGTVCLPS